MYVMAKKIILLFVGVFFLSISILSADDLADILQDLAVQTACLGMYSKAHTGVYVTSRYDDPPDWYNPPMLANRFAEMAGNMTRTITFYGVCFDYAQFAWDDINKYQGLYNKAGMKQWYIASTKPDDPYTIILYDPTTKEKATTISNGVYLKEYSRHKVYAHDGATGHAWIWVQHKNGTWYWVDPTWTDNTGYPWWGIVKNGEEIQYDPDPKYCVASNYPGSRVVSNYPPSPQPSTPYNPSTSSTLFVGSPDATVGLFFGFISAFDFNTSEFDFNNKIGFTLSLEDILPYEYGLIGSFSFDCLLNKNANEIDILALIVGFTTGFQFFSSFVLYAGGGVGVKSPSGYDLFTWKVNGGLRVQLGRFLTKFDISYNPVIGTALSTGLGIAF